MGDRTVLDSATPEFGQLEYSVQWALGASTARIVSAHCISNPHLTQQFERNAKDLLVLDSWIPLGDLKTPNTIDEIVRRGFQLDAEKSAHSGVRVPVGELRLSARRAAAGEELPPCQYDVLLCKAAVGRAQVCDAKRAMAQSPQPGYDSFYVFPPAAATVAKTGKQETSAAAALATYCHEYIVKNAAQLLPMYVVRVEYDPEHERASRERPHCDNCEAAPAAVFCAADNANLCSKCDASVHGNKLASRHTRTPIGKGNEVFGHCRHHPDKLVEFYCPDCHVPVCVYCKMVGNHANGDAARHRLVAAAESYQMLLAASQVADPVLQQRQTQIANQMHAVTERAQAVERMAEQVEAQLGEMYRRALDQLRVAIKQKLDVLLGDELELKRQMAEIARLEDFNQYQQTGDAISFLFSYARQQHMREHLHAFDHFRDTLDVALDVQVHGSLAVAAAAPANASPAPLLARAPTVLSAVGTPSAAALATTSRAVSPLKVKSAHAVPVSALPGAALVDGVAIAPAAAQSIQATQRRTSDFFIETLGALDEMSVSGSDDLGLFRI